MKASRVTFLLFLLAGLASIAMGDTRTYKEYLYDEAGNIIGIRTDVTQSPPIITDLTPSVARTGEAVLITVGGEGLRGVEITPADSRVVIRRLDSSSTQARFEFLATNAAPEGDYALTFTTGLGSASVNVTIQPRLPGLSIAPSPAVFAPGGGPVTLDIRLTSPDIFDHTINLVVSNPAVATINQSAITIVAGDTQPVTPVELTAVALGSTVLDLTSSSLNTTSIPVFITGQYVPSMGANSFYAQPLGVELELGPQPPAFIETGPFASTLSVLKQLDVPTTGQAVTPVLSTHVGVLLGDRLIKSVAPVSLLNGTGPNNLTVTGLGLEAVTSVSIVPPDGLTLGAPVPNADGTSVLVPVTVADDAPTGRRQVVLSAGTGFVPVASPEADRFYVLDMLPRVESTSPVVVVRDSPSVPFTVRGRNLQGTQAIDIAPGMGMVGVDPVINAEGTELLFNLSVPANEPLGPRTLTVTTLAGSSDDTSSVANTFNVVNVPSTRFSDVMAPTVGVVREASGPAIQPLRGRIRSGVLGVTLGGVVTGINPATRRIGESFTLTINGSGLEGVDVVEFIPNIGVTTTLPVIATDGNSLTVEVSIALDAPQTVRRIAVVDSGVILSPSTPAAIAFTVTGFEPVIESLQPLFVEIGASPVRLTVRGQFLDNAASVSTLPVDDGVAISSPVVSADGTSLGVDIIAAAGVLPGERVVVVQTPSGVTSDISSIANTITFVGSILGRVSDIVAPQLGIVKENIPPAPDEARTFAAPLVGVELEQVVDPGISTRDVYAKRIGVSIGAVAYGVSPPVIAVSSSATLTISGFALGDVNSVSFVPPDGITLTGVATVSPDGTQITLPVTVATDAATTLREVVVSRVAGTVSFTDVLQGHLRIAGSSPEIFSIDPIQGSQGTTVTLLVRGLSLQDASSVTATPSDGITFATVPVVNAAGTEIRVQMEIDATATPVARVISVVTPVGSTGSESTPANNFLIVPLQ